MKITTCADCPNTFIQSPNGRRKYCDACQLRLRRKRAQEYRKTHPQKKKPKKRIPAMPQIGTLTIPDLNRMARQQGLTYGQLVAQMKM